MTHKVNLNIKVNEIKVLIGCASFPGINVEEISDELDFLKRKHSLPDEMVIESIQTNLNSSFKFGYNYCEKNVFKRMLLTSTY